MDEAAALGWSGEAKAAVFPFRLGRGAWRGFLSAKSRASQMILVWCFGLPIYISNLMAHKLLAKWFHYSPSATDKRGKRWGGGGVGSRTLVNRKAVQA